MRVGLAETRNSSAKTQTGVDAYVTGAPMRNGHTMLGTDAISNYNAGISHLKDGISMMKPAPDQADTSMSCMRHRGMI